MLSNGALDGQEKIVLAHKLPLSGFRGYHRIHGLQSIQQFLWALVALSDLDYKSLVAKFGNDTGNAINLFTESLELGRYHSIPD